MKKNKEFQGKENQWVSTQLEPGNSIRSQGWQQLPFNCHWDLHSLEIPSHPRRKVITGQTDCLCPLVFDSEEVKGKRQRGRRKKWMKEKRERSGVLPSGWRKKREEWDTLETHPSQQCWGRRLGS